MIYVILYSRKDCHLCEVARENLDALQAEIPHELVVIDVDSNEDLQRAYGFEVPVVEVGPYRLKAPFELPELRMTLKAAFDRAQHIDAVEKSPNLDAVRRRISWTKADAFSYWFANHYLAVFNFLVLIYFGLPFLAPTLMKAGLTGPAKLIYTPYSYMCHQLAFRSFFLYGEQAAYPRAAAGVSGLLNFTQASGLGESNSAQDLYAARSFEGNSAMGYKVALCERDIAIYGAILLFGLLYALSGRRLPALPWYLWILIGLVPIGMDGVSQLISQPPFSLLAYRESTPFLRALTGALFGFTTAWFGYPLVEVTMAETRQIMANKLLRVRKAMTGSLASN
jgi:uncharacterized membrane protein